MSPRFPDVGDVRRISRYPDTGDATRRGTRRNLGTGGNPAVEILLGVVAMFLFPFMMIWATIEGFFGGIAVGVGDKIDLSVPKTGAEKSFTRAERARKKAQKTDEEQEDSGDASGRGRYRVTTTTYYTDEPPSEK